MKITAIKMSEERAPKKVRPYAIRMVRKLAWKVIKVTA
jgi:hypothetical protein